VAAQLSASPAVSHNYLRRNKYNLWFTVTLPSKQDLKKAVAAMAKSAGVKDWLFLPSLRTFKIQFQLTMGNKAAPAPTVPPKKKVSRIQKTYKIGPAFIRELQHDIPLCSRPYQAAAKKLRIGESEIVDRLKYMISTGALRRVAAVLRHAKAGFSINIMVAWAPDEDQKERLGAVAAAIPQVSHCYERPVSPAWPYSIYTMVHAKSVEGGQAVIKKIARQSGVAQYAELPTLKEFKKVRVKYF
jgi:DNA-binding Lrp family transcriptional regulator